MSRTTAALAVILITLMALIAAGCAREDTALSMSTAKGKYKLSLMVMKPPIKKGYNDLALTVRDSSGRPVADADIKLTPWMPEMDHGVMGIPKVSHIGSGVYKYKVFLNMPGRWELRVSVKSGEVADSAIFNLDVVGG